MFEFPGGGSEKVSGEWIRKNEKRRYLSEYQLKKGSEEKRIRKGGEKEANKKGAVEGSRRSATGVALTGDWKGEERRARRSGGRKRWLIRLILREGGWKKRLFPNGGGESRGTKRKRKTGHQERKGQLSIKRLREKKETSTGRDVPELACIKKRRG